MTTGGRLRVAVAVYGDITHDSRVRREAIALADAGHSVTIYCLGSRGDPTAEFPGRVRVTVLVPTQSGIIPGSASPFYEHPPTSKAQRLRSRITWLLGYVRNLRAWGRMVVRDAGQVDTWHLHDFAALLAVAPHVAKRAVVVYDVHDLFTETGTGRRLPGPLRRAATWYETRLARRAAVVVAVNQGIADEVAQRLRPRRLIVVHNAAPRWTPPEPQPDLIREHLGLAPGTPVILYHGLLSRSRGLERLCEALLQPELATAHLALLGYGQLRDLLVETAADARYDGRIHVLDAVAPDALLPWVASADVGAMAMPPLTRNLYLSTPNKLFECLAAGTPPVVSDFPLVRRIVMDDPVGPLGATCDPLDTRDLTRALAEILGLDVAARSELRQRCLTAAHERWNWESEVAALVAAYDALAASVKATTPAVPSR